MKKKISYVHLLVLFSAHMLASRGSRRYRRRVVNFSDAKNSRSPASAVPVDNDFGDNFTDLTRGVRYGDTYVNRYASVAFKLPKGWTFGSDAHVADLMDVSIDAITGSGNPVSGKMVGLQTVIDMVAENDSTNSSVALVYDDLYMLAGEGGISVSGYFEGLKRQLRLLNPDARLMFSDGIREIMLNGERYMVLAAAEKGRDITQYYIVRRIDHHMLSLIVSVAGGDSLEDILAHFPARI